MAAIQTRGQTRDRPPSREADRSSGGRLLTSCPIDHCPIDPLNSKTPLPFYRKRRSLLPDNALANNVPPRAEIVNL